MGKILEVKNLSTSFFTKYGEVKAVNDVSFSLDQGEVLAIVGESGSGKSVTSMSVMQLVAKGGKIVNGEIIFNGQDVAKASEKEMRKIRGKEMSMIFQDPMTCLNPVFTIGNQMEEVLKLHYKEMTPAQRHSKLIEMLEKVGLSNPDQRLKQYPHELSGGMRQRIMIAMSLLCNPKLLIADEPTTALDVTIQAQIMDLMKELSKEYNTSIILITHDLGVVAGIANRVNVMYCGEIVESAPVKSLYYEPKHPYTWGLLKALPRLGLKENELQPIPGSTPDLLLEQKGCPFFDRCDHAMECCRDHKPPHFEVNKDHIVKCWRYHPDFVEEE
ncbi:MAG: ABC transporter ATP-binding protein [Parabacteroides sp.]|nr:ABC transporter ATP-binding protein [Parabacteroides sp.]